MGGAAAKLNAVVRERRLKAKRQPRRRTQPQLAALRIRDLAKLFRARYGHKLPDDDAGRDDLHVALCHLAMLSNSRARMSAYVEIWAPWLTVAEARQAINTALTNPQTWKADQLAWRMRLTYADRTALGITTIGAIDMNRAGRARLRRKRSRERSKARRNRLRLEKAAANAP